MKRTVLLFFLLTTLTSWSQTNSTLIDHRVKYSLNEGYHIIDPTSAVYDDLGFLWIIGNNAVNDQYLFEKQEFIIQRFDGVSFYDVPLPPTEKELLTAFLYRNAPYGLIVRLFFKDDSSQFYHIDPKTFQFSALVGFEQIDTSYTLVNQYALNGQLTFIYVGNKQVLLIQAHENQVVITDSKSFDSISNIQINHVPSHQGTHGVLTIAQGLSYVVNQQGKFVHQVTFNKSIATKEQILEWLLYVYDANGSPVYYYGLAKTGESHFLKLDQETLEFKEFPPLDFIIGKTLYLSQSNDRYCMTLEKKDEMNEFHLYDLENDSALLETLYMDGYHAFAYRNLDKEVVILYGNTLDRILFNQNKIRSYFKGESIRTVKEIAENTYIVATDNKGIYELNTSTGNTKKIQFLYEGKEVPITAPREIVQTNKGFIFNDAQHLYEVDQKYTILKKYEHSLMLEETIKVGDTIFKAGVNHWGIQRFSLKDKTYHFLESSSFFTREFNTDGANLLGISVTKGMYEYAEGKVTFYTPDGETPENLLSIHYNPTHGFLLSTKQGKVYSFDRQTKTFQLFYEDPLKASIVGIIFDNSGVMWLNTYAGIVSYNLKTKEQIRYTKKDGIYELEGNRYSTYKDSKGTLFMGSFKGLSIFKPEELSSNDEELTLQFSELSFFDTQEDIWKTRQKPEEVRSIKEIVLPAFNQRFSARVRLQDIVQHKDFKYRYRLISKMDERTTEWNPLYLENEIVFSNLSAGEYTLQVEVLSSINKKLGKTLELSIVSQKVFYKTWWFVLLVVLMFIGVFIYVFYQFKTKQQLYAAKQIAINEAKIKEAMMLEIHHRIKNNLQVVSGLLSLQAFNSDDENLKSKLKDSQGRIESIAGIHNILYSGDNQESIVVDAYFKNIIDYNKTIFPRQVQFVLEVESVELLMDKAIPLALILNELINNSHKHAFANTEEPQVNITFYEKKSEYYFLYADNGTFKEKDTDQMSMGTKIIGMMVAQLKGKQTMRTKDNLQMKIVFPKRI